MNRFLSRRLSPGTAISIVALFLVLGGTSFAAVKALAPPNSVGSAQVINGSLKKKHLATSAVTALKGNRGPQGAQGSQGAAGPAGSAGVAGSAGPMGASGPSGPAGTPGGTGSAGATGATGAKGATGSSGPSGSTGPAGPTLIATGLVSPAGALGFTQGPLPTVTHPSAGNYGFSIAGFGTGCTAPSLTTYAFSAAPTYVMSWGGGSCGGGGVSTTIFTSDGVDHYWSYLLIGTGGGGFAPTTAPQQGLPTH